MLSRVEVRTRQGDLLKLPLLEENDSGYIIAEMNGIGPVKATLVSSSFAGVDGEIYQSARREARNITMKLELDPDPATDSVWGLRNRLYDFFMPKSEVSLRYILQTGLAVEIMGRVESCSPDHFSREPMVDISIMCFQPDFYELEPRTLSGLLTDDADYTQFEYEGTVETGIVITVEPDRSLDELTVYHLRPDGETETLTYDNAPLQSGDELTISTVFGEKGATLKRSGVVSSVLYGISPVSKWIELQPGLNGIRVYATGTGVPVTIEYVTKYGGL